LARAYLKQLAAHGLTQDKLIAEITIVGVEQ
jgi:hypothetical protein